MEDWPLHLNFVLFDYIYCYATYFLIMILAMYYITVQPQGLLFWYRFGRLFRKWNKNFHLK